MAELKTKVNDASVTDFLNTVENEEKRRDCFEIVKIMQQVTNAKPKMWGANIVGFGDYRYKYESGRENDWFVAGFSPRKANITLYGTGGFTHHDKLLQKLGKHSTGKGCLYIKKLRDVDLEVLKDLVNEAVKASQQS